MLEASTDKLCWTLAGDNHFNFTPIPPFDRNYQASVDAKIRNLQERMEGLEGTPQHAWG
jgi:hypothetical protein